MTECIVPGGHSYVKEPGQTRGETYFICRYCGATRLYRTAPNVRKRKKR